MSGLQPEEWRTVVGYEGIYEVSSTGRVRSVTRTVTWSDGRVRECPSIVLSHTRGPGYAKVQLYRNKSGRIHRVHVLVCEAFHGARPEGMVCCHSDGNKSNNHSDNVRWDTPRANTADAIAHGHVQRGERHHRAKLTQAQVDEIRREAWLRGECPTIGEEGK